MKIILDTNAFYYSFGGWDKSNFGNNNKVVRDKFDELLSDKNNHKVISTITLCEFLVRYRHDTQIIRKGLFFIKDNIDQIYLDPFLPLEMKDIGGLVALSDAGILKRIDAYMEKKVEVESRFSTFFLGLIVVQYTSLYFEKYNELIKPEILTTYVRRMPDNIKSAKEKFILAFRDGYNSDNVERVIKECFNETLYSILVSWTSFLELVKNDPSSDLTEAELAAIFDRLNNTNPNLKKIHKFKSKENNISGLLKELYKNSVPENNRKFIGIYETSLRNKGVQPIQICYMDWIISKMVKRGAKFHKNDILDMLIATVLKDKDTDVVLISFDEDMQEFIKEIDHVSQIYIEKLYI